jgi:plasmid stabilization system protein ParE
VGRQPRDPSSAEGPPPVTVSWTSKAVDDLARLHEFLAPVNARAAHRAVQALVAAAGRLAETPRLGERLDRYDPREVRRVLVGRYELRYEVRGAEVVILRLWHTREDR